jgi:hypothetical protein
MGTVMSIRTAFSVLDAYDYHTELIKAVRSVKNGDADDRIRCVMSDSETANLPYKEQIKFAEKIFQVENIMLSEAQTIFVSKEIVDEINEAKQTLIDTVIIEQDVFTPYGLIVLEKPFIYDLVVEEGRYTEQWSITSICYSMVDSQININLYGRMSKITDKSGEVYADLSKPGYGRNHMLTNDTSRSSICLADITVFAFGDAGVQYDDALISIKKFLISFFRLTYEYLERDTEKPSRPSRRRAERENRPKDGYIVNLKLRRTVYETNGDGEHSSPSYAFRVRGHWKRAYMRSRKFPVGDPRGYRHVYVKDYIKGRGDFIESKRLVRVEK